MKYIVMRVYREHGKPESHVVGSLRHAGDFVGAQYDQVRKAIDDGSPVRGWFIDECPQSLWMSCEPYAKSAPKGRLTEADAAKELGIPETRVHIWCLQNHTYMWGGQYWLTKSSIETIRRQLGGAR